MGTLYVKVYGAVDSTSRLVPVESLVVLHTLRCLNLHDETSVVCLKFVETSSPEDEPAVPCDTSQFMYSLSVENDGDVPPEATMCPLPVFVSSLKVVPTVVAGLSAVLRCILRACAEDHPLLGFRQSCLISCAEVSVWTRFCEVDVIKTVKSTILEYPRVSLSSVPVDLARLEEHLAHAPRLHNVRKHRQQYAKSIGSKEKEEELAHTYAEGPYMTLADIMLLPCFYILLHQFPQNVISHSSPLVSAWFARVSVSEYASRASYFFKKLVSVIPDVNQNEDCVLPIVPKESLYKGDPGRYKPRSNKMFTQQSDVEASLAIVTQLQHNVVQMMLPWGEEVELNWDALPVDVRPEGGHLPEMRQNRKGEQLANMARAVLKVAEPGNVLVDFCSGSGHLGLLLAWLLPSCHIVLLENKDKSLQRAAQRITKLGLKNVQLVQSNLDYFQAKFDVGIALHACGVATDLVLQMCVDKRASFVVCPCCYGSIQNGHTVTYPRSKVFCKSTLSDKDYLVLGHCADQTHGEAGIKTGQGNLCMAAIDTDRLLHAQERGYGVHLSKMSPQSCSPKNNLLIGVPLERSDTVPAELSTGEGAVRHPRTDLGNQVDSLDLSSLCFG